MNKITPLLVAVAAVMTSSCAATKPPPELNAAAFTAHFADEARCSAFVDNLVLPAAQNMASLRSVSVMRSWLADHPKNVFSGVVANVQQSTKQYGVMHPKQKSDQIRVTKSLYLVLKRVPGFSASTCGPDVREAVMDALYKGIGGPRSFVAGELEEDNVNESSEQRWVLLTAIMAGHLPKEWAR